MCLVAHMIQCEMRSLATNEVVSHSKVSIHPTNEPLPQALACSRSTLAGRAQAACSAWPRRTAVLPLASTAARRIGNRAGCQSGPR